MTLVARKRRSQRRVVNRAWAWFLKNCRASIRPDTGAKLRFSVSDRVFTIAVCINIAVSSWCNCG